MCDWSSDVCSSDLITYLFVVLAEGIVSLTVLGTTKEKSINVPTITEVCPMRSFPYAFDSEIFLAVNLKALSIPLFLLFFQNVNHFIGYSPIEPIKKNAIQFFHYIFHVSDTIRDVFSNSKIKMKHRHFIISFKTVGNL